MPSFEVNGGDFWVDGQFDGYGDLEFVIDGDMQDRWLGWADVVRLRDHLTAVLAEASPEGGEDRG